ncbi:ubiquinone biosynthesis accessory factor UbiJ [Marinimicrobium agarilyticum]|uniref:ubiquinone biosynthesis accessory factor UbiJ n=1 Tax=Marinimicrobium agarilyticum TaxID=306546 RepID=UPI000410651B|nr:SCP2 sterol-binding domain-containing protein [Marinimicrobium agarilyticum]
MTTTATMAALSAAEAAIQRALQYDPASRLALAKLDGQVLALQFTQPEWTLYVHPCAEGLRLSRHWEGDVQSRLTGRLQDFIGLARGAQTTLAGSGIQLEGSTHLVQELQRITRELDIDWEEALSERLGDVAGHQGAEWLRTGGHWLKAREAEARRLLGEFLTQEAAVLVGPAELNHFYEAVDELALDVDRAQARLAHLRARLTAHRHPKE